MEFIPLLAGFNPLAPIITALTAILTSIDNVTHSIGWSLVLLAAVISLALWPLRAKQFASAANMQKLAPEIKALQAKYKGDPTKLNTATMELYKERGVNPLASCFPMLLQLPILFSVYQAINGDKDRFAGSGWLWIGTPFAANSPGHILAASLVNPDYVLLGCYIVSMYFSFKLAAPPSDPQQAQQQKMMAFISPVMIGFFAIQNKWPSALIVYWLSSNLFTMGQQFVAMRQRKSAELRDGKAEKALPARATVIDVPAAKSTRRARSNGTALPPSTKNGANGSNGSGNGSANGASGTNGSNGNGSKSNGSGKSGSGTNAAAKRRR